MDKKILEWDECNIVDNEVEYMDEDEIRNELYKDTGLFTMRWDNMTENLSYIMKGLAKRNYYKNRWVASVNNFGWRNQNGTKTFRAENGQELLREILPKTNCTFRIFKDGRNGIKIQNFHHDSPMGNEWYYIKPMTKREVELDEE